MKDAAFPQLLDVRWTLSLRLFQEIPQTNLFMFLFLLGFFYKNILKLELTSFQKLLIILCSMGILKFSSKSVAQGVAGHFIPSFIYLANIYWTPTLFSALCSALESTLERSDMPFWNLQTDGRSRHQTDEQITRIGIKLTPCAMKGTNGVGGVDTRKDLPQPRWSGKSSGEVQSEIEVERRNFLTGETVGHEFWHRKLVRGDQGNVREELEMMYRALHDGNPLQASVTGAMVSQPSVPSTAWSS